MLVEQKDKKKREKNWDSTKKKQKQSLLIGMSVGSILRWNIKIIHTL